MKLRKSILPADLFTQNSHAASDKRAAKISLVALVGVVAMRTVGGFLPRGGEGVRGNVVLILYGACFLIFIATLVYTGVRMVGRSAGLTGFWRSLLLTLWRSFLYVILPSIVLAVLALIIFGRGN